TVAIATAYRTAPTTNPTRFLDGSCRARRCIIDSSSIPHDLFEVEKDKHVAALRALRTSDARHMRLLLDAEHRRGLDLALREAIHLLHFVDERTDGFAVDFREQDAVAASQRTCGMSEAPPNVDD